MDRNGETTAARNAAGIGKNEKRLVCIHFHDSFILLSVFVQLARGLAAVVLRHQFRLNFHRVVVYSAAVSFSQAGGSFGNKVSGRRETIVCLKLAANEFAKHPAVMFENIKQESEIR